MKYIKINIVNCVSNIEHITKKNIYIVIKEKLIIMHSPNNLNDVIYIDINEKNDSYWEYFIKNEKLTLYPSINFVGKNGKAHFYLIESKVYYVK